MARVRAYPDRVKDHVYLWGEEGLSTAEIVKNVKERFPNLPGVKMLTVGKIANLLYRVRKEKKETPAPIPSLDTPGEVLGGYPTSRAADTTNQRGALMHKCAELRGLGYRWEAVREELEKTFPEVKVPSVSGLIKALNAYRVKNGVMPTKWKTKKIKRKVTPKVAKPTWDKRTNYKITITNAQGMDTKIELAEQDAKELIEDILMRVTRSITGA